MKKLLLTGVLAAALGLAACSNNGSTSSDSPADHSATSNGSSQPAAAPAAPATPAAPANPSKSDQ